MASENPHPRICAAIARLGLSARQREIVEALALGMGHDAIAQLLGISPSTLRSHFRHIFSTVHLSNRVQLLALVLAEVVGEPVGGPGRENLPPDSSRIVEAEGEDGTEPFFDQGCRGS